MVRKFMLAASLIAVSGSVSAENVVKTKATGGVPMEKVVCHSEVDTGSLVAKRKVCKTKAEWDREQLRTRDSMNPTQSCRGSDAGTIC